MATTTAPPTATEPAEQRIVLRGVAWDTYEAMNDALRDRRGVRMIYCAGSLTIMVTSHRHDWYGERLGQLVVAVAEGLDILWEDAGQATYRRKEMEAGLEGDKTFFLGEHAELMRGSQNIDPEVQPPPDLAIEVEISHPADAALTTWGRIGVPEVWRFEANAGTFGIWIRREDGSYAPSERSRSFPFLTAADLLALMHLADELGAARWHSQLGAWVRDTLAPRRGGGA